MESFIAIIALIFSVFALITSSKTTSQLIVRIFQLEKEIEKLQLILSKLRKGNSSETESTITTEQSKVDSEFTSSVKTEPQPLIKPEPHQTKDFVEESQDEKNEELPIAENQTQLHEKKPTTEELFPNSIIYSQPTKKRTSRELEALIGGKFLNRIGAIAMIIAVGFFLKFAFDNNWIYEWTRVSMGAVFGIGMLTLAGHFYKKGLSIFSQGLVGVGVSSLYLSVFAAYNFYQLLPQIPAFIVMMLITVVAFFQALKFNSLAAAILALAGGFLTPFLLPSAHPNEIGLFTYIALLDVGILILVIAKEKWIVLEYIARAATYCIYFAWYFEFYNPNYEFIITIFHLSLFWMIFFGFEVYRIAIDRLGNRGLVTLGSSLNMFAFYLGLVALLDNSYHSDDRGWVTLLLGIIYFGTYYILNKQGKADETLRKQYIITAIVLLVIATMVQYKNYTAVTLLSIEAITLFWCGTKWKMGFVSISSIMIFALTTIVLFDSIHHINYGTQNFTLILNYRALGMWTLILSLAGSSKIAGQLNDRKTNNLLRQLFTYSWIIALFSWLSLENNDYFQTFINYNLAEEFWLRSQYTLTMSFGFVWGSYGILLFIGGWLRKNREVLDSSLVVSLISFVAVAINCSNFSPILDHTFLFNIRAGLLVFLMILFTFQLNILRRNSKFIDRINYKTLYIGIFGLAILFLIFELITVETYSYYQKQLSLLIIQYGGDSTHEYLITDNENMQQLMLSVVWLVYSILMMIMGFWKKNRSLRISSISLSGIVILKVFLFDLSFLTLLYRVISFFGLGVILLLTSYFYQRYKQLIVGEVNETHTS
ncbi:MAG: DUF2339 domain-containing protein [Bacteroidetes bacterium]|nr:DUF2339 domain-containing protein [Bacteroidota bacterium]